MQRARAGLGLRAFALRKIELRRSERMGAPGVSAEIMMANNTVTEFCDLGNALNFIISRFTSLKNGENSKTYFLGLLGELNETVLADTEHSAWHISDVQ